MAVDFSHLVPGQEVSRHRYIVDMAAADRYRDAVGDESSLLEDEHGRKLAPPMAVAALGLRGVIADLGIPDGTLHAGQELDFVRPVPAGEVLECQATLSQNSVRGGWRFMVVRLEVTDSGGRLVMDGKSTIMLPVQA